MKAFKEDGIALVKLKDGTHKYEFGIGDDFFGHFENSSLTKGQLEVDLVLQRLDQVFQANLSLKGHIQVNCDACLNEIPLPVSHKLDFVIKLSDIPRENDEDREVYYVQKGEGIFYLSKHIYDLVYIGIPIRKVCEDPGNTKFCNTDVVGKMNELNNDDDTDEGTDPRWDKLKDLLN